MRYVMTTSALAAVLMASTITIQADDRPRGCGTGAGRGHGLEIVGLTADQRLVCFAEDRPNRARAIGLITGLLGDTTLVGIDFRPATGELYGVGNAGGLYTLDPRTAVATFKAQLSVPLAGQSFGVDFNPTVDRLRIVSDAGQNLRANVNDGVAITDTALNYTAGTVATGVVAAAYTNNDADVSTATTLVDVDVSLDQVAIQAPPNAGTLNPTGKLGLDAIDAGFDIYSQLENGRSVGHRAFAAIATADGARFYAINLLTGQARLRGRFDDHDDVVDIAIPLDQR
jgi:hypothetical protein